MRAVVIHAFGGRDRLELAEVPEPPLPPDGDRIAVGAAGVSPVGWQTREGQQTRSPQVFPIVLGRDAAGVVEAVCPAARERAPGAEVFAPGRKHVIGEGIYAEQVDWNSIRSATRALTPAVAGRTVSIVQPGEGHQHTSVRPGGPGLSYRARWLAAGRLRVRFETTFPLEQAAGAHELLEAGHVRGKIALTVSA
ncbi:MAG: zinc-binding dehydrogenase [Gaiellaceae bacterium]